MNKNELVKLLYDEIPTTQFMKVEVRALDEKEVTLTCPLIPNHNHIGSAFGGSLSTMLILAAYSITYALIEAKGHVLIKGASINYLIPVEEEIIASCRVPSDEMKNKFIQTFNRRGKARITLESYITLANGQIGCKMSCEMVGIKIAKLGK